jgi:hypothetical protein
MTSPSIWLISAKKADGRGLSHYEQPTTRSSVHRSPRDTKPFHDHNTETLTPATTTRKIHTERSTRRAVEIGAIPGQCRLARWKREFLPLLQVRWKRTKDLPNLRIGDLVLMQETSGQSRWSPKYFHEQRW